MIEAKPRWSGRDELARMALLVTLGLAVALAGCGETVDGRVVDVGTDISLTRGGPGNSERAPSCGPCDDGTLLTTAGDDICVGATTVNVCGGCTPVAVTPGEPCGPCGGTWTCDDTTDDVVCVGGGSRNACGGCTPLDAPVNFGCYNGVYTCAGPDEVVCRETGSNPCGGDADVVFSPPIGTGCGNCGQGLITCDGANATRCSDEALGQNACGGCEPLAGPVGGPCGCAGTWTCEAGGVVCLGDRDRNVCGGCSELSVEIGGACTDGVWRCNGEALPVCAPLEANACGGDAELDGSPGAPCGACQDGVLRCGSSNGLQCVGATSPNPCGGCGVLQASPGETCGTDRTWQCRGGTLDCTAIGQRNACGGTEPLDLQPGVECGDCNAGVALCVSANRAVCVGAGQARNVCGGCQALRVDGAPFRGAPGDACGTCDSGSWTCVNPNSVTCAGDVAGTLRRVFADRDGDGFGAPDDVREVCAVPAGYVENAYDCNDEDARARPGGVERCNGLDDDCDGAVDEAFIAYQDADQDGFGDPDSPVVRCDVSLGYSRTADDCDDNNAMAFPGQTEAFAEPRADGTWDYDCDGLSTVTLTDSPTCENPPLCGTDGHTYALEGWAREEDPNCGETGAWLLRCELTLAGCTATVDPDPRPQLCR